MRTIITLGSIFFAVLLSMMMRSMQLGSYDMMIDNSVRFYSGYLQVHDSAYWENKSINRMMENTASLRETIETTAGVESAFTRLETFALSASDELTRPVMVMGITPEAEDHMSGLAEKLTEGVYLKDQSKGVMISEGLSSYLKLGVQDTIVLIGQGYHGVNAAAKYPIEGIIEHPNPQMNKNMVYLPVALAQSFVYAPNRITSYVINVTDRAQLPAIKKHLKNELGGEYEVMDWADLQPELQQMIESDNSGGVVMMLVLYMVIGFGIFGTIMMMTMERFREFGVLVAVGMRKVSLATMITLEALWIGILGVIISFVVGVPILISLHENPIPLQGEAAEAMIKMGVDPVLPFSLNAEVFAMQGILVLLILMGCLLYPYWKIARMKVVEAVHA
ncbi:ABC transporter permease [Algivirga pacifica]|uniref:ABC transporter permease n=2 Tax=Algivirga pacifica TaxID=1162670 RepID=A0ABP9CZL3_9BACT